MGLGIGIVGGGIVGLSTAFKISKAIPDCHIVLFEKEDALATHQTGRNSGVIHSGIYYKPGSLKAKNCRDGKKQLEAFCADYGVKFELCGKVIVALDEAEASRLQNIFDRGQANGVKCEVIDRARLTELEPHVAGIKAIYVPETGIVDYVGFCEKLGQLLRESGHEIKLGTKVLKISESPNSVNVQTSRGDQSFDYIVNCGGLQSDKVAEIAGVKPGVKIVPFRGEYFELTTEAEHLCKNLIYPVPDPAFPFLGVHFTRMVLGGVECGPNAVLAFAREGYSNGKINLGELLETLGYSGFQRMAAKHWRMGAGEMWRSVSKAAFVSALQRLVPEIQAKHLHKAPAGVRAQAVQPDGSLVDDFAFAESPRGVHVLNAPSPAATASLAIADGILDMLQKHVS